MTNRTSRADTEIDGGFTLIELTCVVLVLGLIATALSTTIVTLLRVAPRISAIVDDSQGTLQLLSSIERDAAATPPSGVDVSTNALGCTDGDPGSNIVQFTWNDGTIVRRAAYRLVAVPDETRVVRTTCSGDSVGTLVMARTNTIAHDLVPPVGGGPPVAVSMIDNVLQVVVVRASGTTTFSAALQTQLGVIA